MAILKDIPNTALRFQKPSGFNDKTIIFKKLKIYR